MPRIPGVNSPGNPDDMTVGNMVGAVILPGERGSLREISTGVGRLPIDQRLSMPPAGGFRCGGRS